MMPRKRKLSKSEMQEAIDIMNKNIEKNRIMDPYPDVNEVSPNRLVPLYLMSSYLYYQMDTNVFSDTDYDRLCKRLAKEWKNIDHVHKKYMKLESLQAGTGFGIAYTEMMKSAAVKWLKDYQHAQFEELNNLK